MSIEGQGRFFAIYFPGFICFVLYKTKISGERLQDHWSSLVLLFNKNRENVLFFVCFILTSNYVGDGEEKKSHLFVYILIDTLLGRILNFVTTTC